MSMTYRTTVSGQSAAYGGLIDAIGGVATIVLAICGLAGINPPMFVAIATIVFGVALMIQGGAILSDYAQMIFPTGATVTTTEEFSGNSLSVVFLVGAAGIVLGVLGVLGLHPNVLSPIAMIAFGTALALSSNSVRDLYTMRRAASGAETQQQLMGGEILASEMASGSAGVQALGGLAAVVLGVIALAGNANDLTINLAALIVVGATLVLTGSSLSTTVLGFMRRTP